jgi:hypothetical protein
MNAWATLRVVEPNGRGFAMQEKMGAAMQVDGASAQTGSGGSAPTPEGQTVRQTQAVYIPPQDGRAHQDLSGSAPGKESRVWGHDQGGENPWRLQAYGRHNAKEQPSNYNAGSIYL